MLVTLIAYTVSITNNILMNKRYLQKFAKNLKKIRKERNLTQEDIISDKISRSMVSHIETARTDITISKLKAIADNIGINVKDLFDFE